MPSRAEDLISEIEAQSRLDGLLFDLLSLQPPDVPSPALDELLAERLGGPGAAPRAYSSSEEDARSLLRPAEDVVVVPDGGAFWALVSVPRLGRRGGPPRDVWRRADGKPCRAWGRTRAAAICAALLAARIAEAGGLCAFAGSSPALARRLDYTGARLLPEG
jgi:hypothetical protein